MTRIKDPSLAAAAEAELPWLQRLAGIEFMAQYHAAFPAGIHLLPSEVEHRIAVLATGPLSPSR
jgi:hypothetical protein